MLADVVTRTKCYTENEESNNEKKSIDIKQRVPRVEGLQYPWKRNTVLSIRDKSTFKRGKKVVQRFTPLNNIREQI